MISVNLLDYKQELRKIAMQKIIINAIGAVLFFIFLIVIYWCFQKIEINYRANELKQLEGQVRELTAQTTKIQSMKLQAKRTEKIIKKINELRANQFQVTQILEDLILPVPDEIWLTSVRQLGIKEIKGKKIPLIFIGDSKKMKTKKKSNKSKTRPSRSKNFWRFVDVYLENIAMKLLSVISVDFVTHQVSSKYFYIKPVSNRLGKERCVILLFMSICQ